MPSVRQLPLAISKSVAMKRACCLLGLLSAGLFVLVMPSQIICQEKSKPKCAAERKLKFVTILSGHGKGSATSFYESSNGVKIERTGEWYPSPARAAERLEAELKDAVRIIERRPVYEKRRKVGERVMAVFTRNEADPVTGLSGEVVRIMSTYEEVFSFIEAPTMCIALAFERQWER